MPIIHLAETIKRRKEELGLTISAIASESGVGIRTINRILAGEDVRYSSISSVLKSLNLNLSVEKY